MDKTNAADLSRGVFGILISVTWTKNTKSIAVPQILSKSGKQRCQIVYSQFKKNIKSIAVPHILLKTGKQ